MSGSCGHIEQEGLSGSSSATPAELEQLLWLAEAEHLLGTACLQLAFAAVERVQRLRARSRMFQSALTGVAEDTTMTQSTIVSGTPTANELAQMAAGGRRPWGYSTGPFAQVVATSLQNIPAAEKVGAMDVGGNLGVQEEETTIAQLEVSKVFHD